MNKDTIVVYVDPDIQDLIPGFLENRHQDVAGILEALKQGDFEAVQTLGHNMKGMGAGYGFEAITEIGDLIERAAKAKDAAGVQKYTADLLTYLGRVKVIYE